MSFLKQHYGPAEGPLGFPQTDRQARALEALLKELPKDDAFRYRKRVVEGATTELSPGERADVSWISAEAPDRQGEVVLARGMNDGQFALNPIVTLQHAYHLPPAGRSLWRKRVKAGPGGAGVKAKTLYPARPDGWPADNDWVPDAAFALVQSGLLNGKSIGFLPVKVHAPTTQEAEQLGWSNVSLVIDEWILLEYACVFLPAQQHALVEQVSKALPLSQEVLTALGLPGVIPFCPLETLEKALLRAVERIDVLPRARQALADGLERLRGRI